MCFKNKKNKKTKNICICNIKSRILLDLIYVDDKVD